MLEKRMKAQVATDLMYTLANFEVAIMNCQEKKDIIFDLLPTISLSNIKLINLVLDSPAQCICLFGSNWKGLDETVARSINETEIG